MVEGCSGRPPSSSRLSQWSKRLSTAGSRSAICLTSCSLSLACAIGYDTRHRSRQLAELCAEIMAAAGIKDILIITTPEDQAAFQRLLGDGSELGMSFSYVVQPAPEGLAQAFLLGEGFLVSNAQIAQ